ncbi:hypothetical protein K8I61_04375 [bacterium]|nr:hypothetical protein [bacterium]
MFSDIPEYAFENDLVEIARRDRVAAARAYVPGRAIVLGRGSDPARELNMEACAADGVRIWRRPGGGCAVWLDEGNVVVAMALPCAGIGDNLKYFANITAALIETLGALGVTGMRREGACDLAIGGRKVGGACIHRTRDVLHYATTLLVAPRVDLMTRYLAHPPKEPEYRRGRAHADFVSRLPLPADIPDAPALAARLSDALPPVADAMASACR